MMGQHTRSESLFYYFRLEDQIPENHLLRLIDRHVSFDFVRAKLKGSYSETGRPSIDPELLLRILLIGYLYGITSERKLVEELRNFAALLLGDRTKARRFAAGDLQIGKSGTQCSTQFREKFICCTVQYACAPARMLASL